MEDTNRLAELVAAAAWVRRTVWRGDVHPDSPAATELNSALEELQSDEPILRLVVLSNLWTMVASDQLGAMATLIGSQQNLLGIFPIARSVVEHCAAVLWCLSPDLGTPIRGARAALAARKSAEATCATVAHLTGEGSPEHASARTALAELKASLRRDFGLATGEEKDILGQKLASPTEMVSNVGDILGDGARTWQGIYDYLCAVSNHPTSRVFDFIDQDAGRASLDVSDAFLQRLARACLAVYLSALDATVHYFGWETDELDRFHEYRPVCPTERHRGRIGPCRPVLWPGGEASIPQR